MLLAFGAQFVTPKLISRESFVFLYLVLVCAAAFVLFVLALLIIAIRKGFGIQLVKTWGVFLLITLLLAAPQLFTWTFSQASGESFMRGWYNWGNLQDGYLWFYLVNLGVTALLFLPAFSRQISAGSRSALPQPSFGSFASLSCSSRIPMITTSCFTPHIFSSAA